MIPEHLKKYVRNQITVDEDALIKLLQDKDKEIEMKNEDIKLLKLAVSANLEEISRLKVLIGRAMGLNKQNYSHDTR